MLAHITPRGEGLRLVTELKDGERIPECQARLAAQFGMEQFADQKVKDITRLSYLPSKDYMMYVDKERLFCKPKLEEERGVSTPHTPLAKEPVNNVSQPQNVAENFSYNGLKYSTIIEALLKRLATQGSPVEGERNNVLFGLVRELRHICDYNFQTVYMLVAPYFPGLQDAEIRRTIGSAIATNGRSITPMMRGVLNELK